MQTGRVSVIADRAVAAVALCAVVSATSGCPIEPMERLTLPGPYAAVSRLVTDTDAWRYTLDLTVFYPDAEPPDSGWPVVVFCTGWNQARTSYDSMACQLAEHGFVVVTRYFPSLGLWDLGFDLFDLHLEHFAAVLDWCTAQNADPDSFLCGRCDMSRVGATGHSMGGHVALVAAKHDPRIKAVVSLDALIDRPSRDSVGDLSDLAAPTLYIGAEAGGLCSTFTMSVSDPVWLYDYTPRTRQETMIAGADHLDFIQHRVITPIIDQKLCDVGWADEYEVRATASRYMIGWFAYFLGGRQEYRMHFDGVDSRKDETAGTVVIRRDFRGSDMIEGE